MERDFDRSMVAARGARALHHQRSLVLSTAIAALLAVVPHPANAQSVTGSGDLTPGPAQTPNWNLGTSDLYVGDAGTATLTIRDGGSVTNGTAFLGNQASGQGTVVVSGTDGNGHASAWTSAGDLVVGQSGVGTLLIEAGGAVSNQWGYIGATTDTSVGTVSTVTVTGTDGHGNASTWTNAGQLSIGDSGAGALNIAGGGLVTNGIGTIGFQAGSNGMVTVSGSDGHGRASTWANSAQLVIGEAGTGTLRIDDGGLVSSDQGLIGADAGGTGTVAVTGIGSTWNTGNIYLGGSFGAGSGTLSVADGGNVSVSTGNGGAASLYIGHVAGGQGTVTVSSGNGSVSTLATTDRVEVGVEGAGTLNIGAGGFVSAASDTYVGEQATASGTLNLTGDASGRGVLETGSVIKGQGGTTVLNLDGGILRANRNEADFLNGFQTLAAGGEGAWLDTHGYDIGVATAFSGSSTFDKLGLGTLTLTGDSSGFTGTTTISAGTLAVGDAAHASAAIGTGATTVAAGATLGGYGTASGSVTNAGTIAAANALPVFASGANGTFTIAGNLANQGMVNLAAASGQIGNVLKVGGNYVGTNGTLALNTVLNEGGAATKTDQLVVSGNASGNTVIQVHATGAGAQTVGDGIKLVQVGGTSAAGSFRLGNVVQSGAYQYLLYQGGSTNANDWYLRSTLETPPSTPTDADPPPGQPVTPPVAPAYRPGAVGYAMTPLLDADYGFAIMGRLNERVGDIAGVGAGQPAGSSDGLWGRIGGKDFDVDASHQFSADGHLFFGQVGKDWTLARGDQGGSTHAGMMMTLGSMSSGFDDNMRSTNPSLSAATGSVETHAQSVGGYWTKYLADGAYFDGVGQFTHYENKYSDIYGGSTRQNGSSVAASGEVGKPFRLGSTGMVLEPQAQLVYQHLRLGGTSDDISPISGTSTNGLRGRMGLRLSRPGVSADGKTTPATFYVTGDVLRDFLGPNRIRVSDTPIRASSARSWYDLGVGVTTSTGRSSVLYFNVKYSRNLGGEYQRSVFGQVGYRYAW